MQRSQQRKKNERSHRTFGHLKWFANYAVRRYAGFYNFAFMCNFSFRNNIHFFAFLSDFLVSVCLSFFFAGAMFVMQLLFFSGLFCRCCCHISIYHFCKFPLDPVFMFLSLFLETERYKLKSVHRSKMLESNNTKRTCVRVHFKGNKLYKSVEKLTREKNCRIICYFYSNG